MLTADSRRRSFPSLEGMVYLNTAAEGIPPLEVQAALDEYFRDKQRGMDGREYHFRQWEAARELAAGFFGLTVEQQRALWVQQRAPMTFDGHWMWRDFGQKTQAAGFEYGVLPLPSVNSSAPWPYAPPALDCFAINRSTKLADQSLAFLKFLASPPIQAWMTDNWRNISISPGITYTEPETAMFAKTLDSNLMFKSLSSAYGNEVQTTWDAQIEPVSTGQITVDQALATIQKKIDEAVAKRT